MTNVTADQGLITYKSLVVYFNTSVLKLPDGSPPPKSLLSCITVGDMLHYDAVLTYNKIDPSQFFYEATRVWFPHNKVINRQPPTVTAPLPPTADKTIRKNIRKHVKKTLTKDGPLPLYNLYTSLNPDHHSYLKHSIDGLKNIITSNSNYFCLVDNVVHLIPNPDTDNVPTNTSTPTGTEELWGPNLVTKTIQILKSHLKSNGYMTLQQLYDIVSTTNDQHIKKFACTNIGSFQSFLSVHADIFLQSPDGMVSLRKPLSAERKKTAAKQTPNQEAHKDLEAVAVTYVENLLRTASPLHICKLHECVQNGPPNLKQIVGAKHKSLRTFLLQHKGVFRMLPNDLVVLTKDSGPYFSSDDVSVLPDSIDFLKNILMAKGGSLTIAQLVGYLGGASPKIRKCIGGSPASLKAFLKNHSQVFEIDKSDKVRCIENIETKRKSRVQTMPTFYRGIVVYVGPAFGFIKHGQLEADNIYFDVLCYMESEEIEPVKKLNSLITVGDTVDCLYVPNQGEKQTSYRAVALWKIPCETESNSIVVSPVTVLPSPVLLGDARISYLRDDVGYLLADISDKEDFVKVRDVDETYSIVSWQQVFTFFL